MGKWMVWLLVIVNVGLALAVGGILYMNWVRTQTQPYDPDAENPTHQTTPADVDNDVTSDSRTTTPPNRNQPNRQTNPGNQTAGLNNNTNTTPPNKKPPTRVTTVRSKPAPTPQPTPPDQTGGEGSGKISFFGVGVAPAKTNGMSQSQAADFNRRMNIASKLAEEGKLRDALTIIEKIKAELPKDAKAPGLNESIDELRAQIKKKELEEFFKS